MLHEGQRIVYAGDADPFNEVGSPGKVIAVSGEGAHVMWTGGPKQGSIELVEANDLVADRNQATALLSQSQPYLGEYAGEFEAVSRHSMEAHTSRMQVRAAYDEHGESGAVTALDEAGVTATLASYADMAHQTLLGQIHADAHMREALAGLAQDEQDVVVAKVAATLLLDVLRED